MTDEKVSEFKPRRKEGAAINKPKGPGFMGSGLGDFERERCGDCWHFKREPRAGLGVGKCMMMPPAALPTQDAQGNPAQILIRPVMGADYEGCDQFDDTPEDDEEDKADKPAAPSSIIAAG